MALRLILGSILTHLWKDPKNIAPSLRINPGSLLSRVAHLSTVLGDRGSSLCMETSKMGLAGLDSYQDHGGRKMITSLFNFSTYLAGSLESQVGDCRSVTKERGIKY